MKKLFVEMENENGTSRHLGGNEHIDVNVIVTMSDESVKIASLHISLTDGMYGVMLLNQDNDVVGNIQKIGVEYRAE